MKVRWLTTLDDDGPDEWAEMLEIYMNTFLEVDMCIGDR